MVVGKIVTEALFEVRMPNLVAALLAPVVGLAASSAFLATSLNRLVGLSITAPVAAYLAFRQSHTAN